MADPLEDLIRAIHADAQAADETALKAAREALEKARGAWAEGWTKGLDALMAGRPSAPG